MSGGGKTTTQTQKLDPRSQYFVNETRNMGSAGASALTGLDSPLYSPETMSIQDQAMRFMNPWFQQVLDPVNASFDRALEMNRMGVNDAARGAGAFGSARHGVAQAVGMGEVERNRAQILGNLLNNQWQTAVGQGMGYQAQQRELERMQLMDPYLKSQMGVQLRNAALGPTGSISKTVEKTSPNVMGQIAGLGLGIAGNMLLPGAGGLFAGMAGGGIPLLGGGSASYGQMAPPPISFPSFDPVITPWTGR